MKKIVLYALLVISYILLVSFVPELIDAPYWLVSISLLSFYFVSIFLVELFTSDKKDVDSVTDNIISSMNKDSYKCQKDEGVLTYPLNGMTYRAYLWKVNDCFRVDLRPVFYRHHPRFAGF